MENKYFVERFLLRIHFNSDGIAFNADDFTKQLFKTKLILGANNWDLLKILSKKASSCTILVDDASSV